MENKQTNTNSQPTNEPLIKMFSKDSKSFIGMILDFVFFGIIIISMMTLFFKYTTDGNSVTYDNKTIQWLFDYDWIFGMLFLLDYVLRLVVNVINSVHAKKAFKGTKDFLLSEQSIFGLLAIIPMFILAPIWNILRIFKLFTGTDTFNMFLEVPFIGGILKGFGFLTSAIKSQGKTLFTVTVIFMLIVLSFAVVLYNVELMNPGSFSIPTEDFTLGTSFWFTFVTITTIGYGDIYPIVGASQIIVVILSITGIGFISLYTAVIVNGFTFEIERRKATGEDIGVMGGVLNVDEETSEKKVIKKK